MRKRSTVSVDEKKEIQKEFARMMVARLNKMLKNHDLQDLDSTQGKAYREGICAAIEQLLFETDQYQGIRYIDKKEAIKPYAFGCDYSKITDKVEEQVAAFKGADSTRRQYFLGTINVESV